MQSNKLQNNCTFKASFVKMRSIYSPVKIFCSLILFCIRFSAISQPNTTIDLDRDKPKQYQDRQLASEKTGDTKFGFTKKVYQNLVTRDNYYFNARNKFNDIITKAKLFWKDDYTKLLPFYNYSVDITSRNIGDLDTIIYKCTAGILLHDLRNTWIDDIYLLMGKTYLFAKKFDSAQMVFNYINYIYAPKDDGYDIPIGSNASNTNGIFTISTEEKANFLKKLSTKPPARNDNFLWMVRNYLEQDKISQASGLISLLRTDPNFPHRLQTDLHELTAYLFYKQQVYDSAAWHLQKALDNSEGKSEQARWEFLCGQLYQAAQKNTEAIHLFERSIQHTIDPYLDVYARLNIVMLSSSAKKENALQQNLSELYKLGKRDKYENYRDIIYYAAALLQIQQKKYNTAINDLQKSIQFSTDNTFQKQKSFLLLSTLNYKIKSYSKSYAYSDSLQTPLLQPEDKAMIESRKPALRIIVTNLNTIHEQDSLQNLASLKEDDRNNAIKKILKQIRKQQGLKDIDTDFGTTAINTNNNSNSNLFNTTGNPSEFYFLNANLKAQGFNSFKSIWGNRPNVDNWRRQAVVVGRMTNLSGVQTNGLNQINNTNIKDDKDKEVSFASLLKNIPLSKEKIDSSNYKIALALFNNGEIFQNKLEEYPTAVETFEELFNRFPINRFGDQALFDLIYCYTKIGASNKADSAKNILRKTYPYSRFTATINRSNVAINQNDAVTKKYQEIYNLFIEGKFEEAKQQKQLAEKQFGNSLWTPQLLFIEAVYYIKQKQDSLAINDLQNLITGFPKEPLSERAKTMIDVLKRRKEIENYLTNLDLTKNEDAPQKRVDLNSTNTVTQIKPIKKDTIAQIINQNTKPQDIKALAAPAIAANSFAFNPIDPQYEMVILNKVDAMFVNEARNSFNRFNMEKYYNDKIEITITKLNDQFNLLLIGPFKNAGDAINYNDNVRAFANSKIIPWLTADKYQFTIISNKNLDILKMNKDISAYTKFMLNIFPNKF